MPYEYELSREAERYFRRLEPARQRQLRSLLRLLCDDPFDASISAPLHGRFDGQRRARIGDIRVLFEVRQARLVVYVMRIGPRGDVYKG